MSLTKNPEARAGLTTRARIALLVILVTAVTLLTPFITSSSASATPTTVSLTTSVDSKIAVSSAVDQVVVSSPITVNPATSARSPFVKQAQCRWVTYPPTLPWYSCINVGQFGPSGPPAGCFSRRVYTCM
jgi:ABC-type transport system substrate-binding protein